MVGGLLFAACAGAPAADADAQPGSSPDAGLVDAVLPDAADSPLSCVEGAALRQITCAPAGSPCSLLFRVLNYNVHALPESISGENPADRLRRIGEILAARRVEGTHPDVVLLQEAFDKEDRLIDRAGYAHVVKGPEQTFGLDSGLYLLADAPVVAEDRVSFNACAGADCFAEKGAVGVALAVDGLPRPLRILTTHLQAQSENDEVRIQQIDELVPYLEAFGVSSDASIFGGDFNFKAKPDHPSHPSYEHFLARTPYRSSGQVCVEGPQPCDIHLDPEGKTDVDDIWYSTNDHQFHHAPPESGYAIEVRAAALTFTEDFEGKPLSDHWGHEFDYCVTFRP